MGLPRHADRVQGGSRDLGGDKARTTPKLELRKLCRAEAEKWVDIAALGFPALGCIGDWFNPYLTMAPEYDAAEIRVLRKMVENGYIYRGLRPVHWCFDCRSALAEAEVEYRDHVSPSIYVAFPFNSNLHDAGALAAEANDRAELDALRTRPASCRPSSGRRRRGRCRRISASRSTKPSTTSR